MQKLTKLFICLLSELTLFDQSSISNVMYSVTHKRWWIVTPRDRRRAGRRSLETIVFSREQTELSRTIPSFQKKNEHIKVLKNIGTNGNCLKTKRSLCDVTGKTLWPRSSSWKANLFGYTPEIKQILVLLDNLL